MLRVGCGQLQGLVGASGAGSAAASMSTEPTPINRSSFQVPSGLS